MKINYAIKSPLYIVIMIVTIILGIYIAYATSGDFLKLYTVMLKLPIIRYVLLLIVVCVHFYVWTSLSGTMFILRKKSLFNFMMYMTKYELLFVLNIFIIFNIPSLILNSKNFLALVEMIINGIVVSSIIFMIINMINIRIKNMVISIGLFFTVLCTMDFILEHFNWFENNELIFDFSYIFVLPFIYDIYILILILMVVIVTFMTSLTIFISIKKDCFLESVNYEKN